MNEIFWMEQSARDVPASDDWLAPEESVRLASFRIAKRRDEWRLGRWAAKQAVASFLGLPSGLTGLREIEIRPEPGGAPEVFLGGRLGPVSISLSHRAGIALCAVTRPDTALGCDLEVVEHRSSGFLRDFFTDEEQALAARVPAPDRDLLVTMLWSAKESVLKALRVGLRYPATHVLVRPLPKNCRIWEEFLSQTSHGKRFTGWWREDSGILRSVAVPCDRPSTV